MAKPKTKRAEFRETLGSASDLVRLPELPRFNWPRQLNRRRFKQAWRYAQAGSHDAWMYVKRVGSASVSLPARTTYVAIALATLAFGAYSAAAIAVNTMHKYQRDLSNPAVLMNEKNTGTTILDRNGMVLFQGYGAVDRHSIPFNEMPDTLKQATLATEDPDFYQHAGFSWRGTARAAYQDVIHSGKVQGGSTITQQLVKTALLDDEKSFTRKYKEVLLSMELERRYDKNQIMQMYLNSIYYGEGAYGVEAASETYFHKPAKDLTLVESATLAGLPQSPSRYDPNVNPDETKMRRDYVLDRMRERGYLSTATAASSKAQPVQAGTRDVVLKAPHFVFYVLDQLRQQYGEDKIEHGGIVVHTTLDYAKQQKGEEIVKQQISRLGSHNVTNAGLISLDPHNGDIISMVGSVDYNQPGYGAVNVTLAQLQPGSSFKPIAYVTAFTKGWNGATKVDDKPISFPQSDGTVYAPHNYDQKFRGPVTLRRALANSLNIPAIEVLQYANLHDTITMAHQLGIQAPSLTDESRFGLSLVLGGGEVRPIDMASVYGTFANQGNSVPPRAITKVTDRFGDDITKPAAATSHRVVDPRYAYMITNILSDNQARKEEFGLNSPLVLSRPAAAKTGTTNDFRDNWTVGYTPDLVTAVWAGNNDHTPMNNVDGVTGAAPIWHDYMEAALAGSPIHDFQVPAGIVTVRVCPTDGGLVSDKDPNGYTEVFLAEAKPTKPCGWSGSSSSPKPAPPSAPTTPATPAPQEVKADAPPTQPGVGGGDGSNGTPPPNQNPNPGTPDNQKRPT